MADNQNVIEVLIRTVLEGDQGIADYKGQLDLFGKQADNTGRL